MPSFVVDLPATVTQLGEARRRLRAWLDDEVPDEVARGDLLAVAGEFFLHVVFRTGGVGRARIVAERGAGGVRLSVTALDRRPNVRPIAPSTDPLAAGALGRRLVDGCCEEVRVAAASGPVVVASCYRSVPPGDGRR